MNEDNELEGLDYIMKFKERLDIAVAYISDGRDISEDDYSVLEQVFRIYKSGRLVFYKPIMTESRVTASQPDLFSGNMQQV